MHIVVMAWLFVVGTMSMTSGSALAGIAFFALAGVAPVIGYAWIKWIGLGARRARETARGPARSVGEEQVDDRDHADSGGDQR